MPPALIALYSRFIEVATPGLSLLILSLAAWLSLPLLLCWRHARRLLRLRLAPPLPEILTDGAALSPDLRACQLALRSAATELQEAGFQRQQSWRSHGLAQQTMELQELWWNPQMQVHALLSLHPAPQFGQCYEIVLQDWNAQGRSLLTCWRGAPGLSRLRLPQPGMEVQYCAGVTLQEMLSAHLRRLQELDWRCVQAGSACWQAQRNLAEQLLPFGLRAGQLRVCRERAGARTLYRLRLWSALRIAAQHLRAAAWRQWARWRRLPWRVSDAAMLQVAHSWQWQQAYASGWLRAQKPRAVAYWAALIPGALCLWLSWRAQSLVAAGVLLIMLGLHLAWLGLQSRLAQWQLQREAGSRLRHPLLLLAGLLAGPAFGIGLALGLTLGLVQGWLQPDQGGALFWLILFSLVLHLGQLLPLRVYSGGQMLDLLLPWAWPRLLLCLGSALTLFTLSCWLPLPRRLLVLGLVLLLLWRVPGLWRRANAVRLLRAHPAPAGAHGFALWRSLARQRVLGAGGKWLLAHQLPALALRVRPGVSSALFGLSLYLLLALLPALTIGGLFLSKPQQSIQVWKQGQQVVWGQAENPAPAPLDSAAARHARLQ
ncbi:hypothetical protein V8J88_00485 [Massilia sp. W12]|uniref:hypothetical protein n=1 Tax=Massilia sp. W12 TaxID=3126507 RepID=UPI0030CD589A